MIRRYILKTKVTKKALDKDKDQKNESAMNDQIEDKSDKFCVLVIDKDKSHPSEATKEEKNK